jgi:NACHT domain-containing protein
VVVPTGIEAAIVKAIEGSLKGAIGKIGKRLWVSRLSPTARREKAAAEVIEQLARYDFDGQLRLSVVLPEVSLGISYAATKSFMGGLAVQGILHELVAARVMGMSDQVVQRVRENMQMAMRVEFRKVNGEQVTSYAGTLFDEIDRVVRSMIEEIGQNKSGLDDLRQNATVTLLSSNADGIAKHNSYLKRAESIPEVAAAIEWEHTYRTQVKAAHGYIEPPDFERKRKVPIEALFVSPSITAFDETDYAGDVWTLFEDIDRSVLLGDPGGGKSTTSNVLAWHCSKDPTGLVPLLVVLRNFVDNDQSIVNHIESRISSFYQCAAPSNVVEGLLLSGRAVVIFDGLDELLDTSRRRNITNRVELFCMRYPLAKVLVTSRRIGYEEAAMDPDVFSVYQLSEFSDEDVAEYVNNWFTQAEPGKERTVEDISRAFLKESAAVTDLRANPLMLSLMCIIYRGQNWIPRNRPEMYEHCAKLLFEKWDSSRQIYVELKAAAYVDTAIKQLAFWMFTEPGAGNGVTEGSLVREATKFLQPAFSSEIEAEQASRQFVEFCRGRGWVLTDVGTTADGETLFAFMHRTFMEYFAAYELTRQHDGPEKVAKAIIARIAAAEWEMVAELTVQISNKHSREGAPRILQALLRDRRFSSVTSRQNISSFAMRCLGFIHVPISLAADIGRNFAESLIHQCLSNLRISPKHFSILAEQVEAAEGGLISALADALKSSDISRRTAAAEVVMELPIYMADLGISGADSADHERWTRHRDSIFGVLGNEILEIPLDIFWFSAWRYGYISLARLIRESPRAKADPLSVLFRGNSYPSQERGWSDWGSFIPYRLLQSGMDEEPNFPVTDDELDLIGSILDAHADTPWTSAAEVSSRISTHNRTSGSDLLVEKFSSEKGWILVRLMLIGIEGLGEFKKPQNQSTRAYSSSLDAIAWRRGSDGATIPGWIADAFNSMKPERRDLVWLWLNRKVNFVRVDTNGDD